MAVSIVGTKFRAWNSADGKPLAFGKVYTYQAGTNIPKPTYTSEGQETANANPVILNASGYADIYLDGSYKIIVKDANDVEVHTTDPVSDPSQLGSEWINEKSVSHISPSSFSVNGNETSIYTQGRALRVHQDSGFLYGFVVSSSYGGNATTVDVDINGQEYLDVSLDKAWVGIQTSETNGGISPRDFAKGVAIADFSGYLFKTIDDLKSGLSIGGKSVSLKVGDGCLTLESGSFKSPSAWIIKSSIGAKEYGFQIGSLYAVLVEGANINIENRENITSSTINAAIQKLDNGSSTYAGGEVNFPIGQYFPGGEIVVDNGSSFNILNVMLKGQGKQGTNLDFTGQTPTENGIVFKGPIFSGMSDMSVQKSQLSGVKLEGQQSGEAVLNHFTMDRIRSSFNGLNGVEMDRGFMTSFHQVFVSHNASSGFNLKGLHTSVHFDNCYAASQSGGHGYQLTQMTYSALTACASDSNAQYGYFFRNSSTTPSVGCGSENNGRSGVGMMASASLGANRNLPFIGSLAFKNNTSDGGWPNFLYMTSADKTENSAIAIGCRSHGPANPTLDCTVDGEGSYLVEGFNDFPNGVRSTNRGYIHHLPKTKVIRDKSVTAATAIVGLTNPQGYNTSYGGEVIVHAAFNSDPSSSSAKNTATYKLLVDKGAGGGNVSLIAQAGLTTGAGSSFPSFTWTLVGNDLTATPVGSTSGIFFFEILTSGMVKTA